MSGTVLIPLKIYFPARGYQIGVATKSLPHLRETLQAKMGLPAKFKLTLDDGTIVCDPDYFKLLEPQTKLNVVEGSLSATSSSGESMLKMCYFFMDKIELVYFSTFYRSKAGLRCSQKNLS